MERKVKFVHIHAMKAYWGVHVQLHGSLELFNRYSVRKASRDIRRYAIWALKISKYVVLSIYKM
jgi:hypothetical protein